MFGLSLCSSQCECLFAIILTEAAIEEDLLKGFWCRSARPFLEQLMSSKCCVTTALSQASRCAHASTAERVEVRGEGANLVTKLLGDLVSQTVAAIAAAVLVILMMMLFEMGDEHWLHRVHRSQKITGKEHKEEKISR